MGTITLAAGLERLQRSYCLWVGAGLTAYLARAAHFSVPGWAELTATLERESGVASQVSWAYEQRLGACRDALGWERFQRLLRQLILDPISFAALKLAVDTARSGTWVPPIAEDLARLGHSANPIVNFNIETITSILLGYPDSPLAISAFSPPVDGAVQLATTNEFSWGSSRRFARSIYHPHGSLDMGGICVMTDHDYNALDGTLALQLAVHASFGRNLVIVGMSLEDSYLRSQLSAFRPFIADIIWFTCPPPRRELQQWADSAKVLTVDVPSWAEFWTELRARQPLPSQLGLVTAWGSAVSAAERIITNEGSFASAHHLQSNPATATDPVWQRLIKRELAMAAARGEPEWTERINCIDSETRWLLFDKERQALEAAGAFNADDKK